MVYKYNFQKYDKEKMAKAVGLDLPISKKHAYELAKAIKGKKVAYAKRILSGVIAIKTPVKYRRFDKDLAHKPGIGQGRFPVKAAEHILKILKSAEKNAEQKGITNPCVIHVAANRAGKQWHYGRQRRRQMKRAHFEIVLAQFEEKAKKAKAQDKQEKEGKDVKEKKSESKESKTESKK